MFFNPLTICRANQLTGFYMMETLVIKGLIHLLPISPWRLGFLTHSFPMHPFSTPWKNQKTLRFFDVFRGRRKGALGMNGLTHFLSISPLTHFSPIFPFFYHPENNRKSKVPWCFQGVEKRNIGQKLVNFMVSNILQWNTGNVGNHQNKGEIDTK